MAGVEKAGELLAEGEYHFVVTESNLTDKPAGPYWNLRYKVTEGQEGAGRIVFDGASTGEASRPFMKKILEGITGNSWDEDGMEFDPSDFPGLEFDAIVTHVPRSDQPNVKQAKVTMFLGTGA